MSWFCEVPAPKKKGIHCDKSQTRREKRTTSLFAHVASCHPYPCSCFFISSFLPCHFPWFLPGWSPEKPPQTPSSIKLSHDFSRIFRKKVFPPPNPSNPSGCNIPQIPPKSHPARDPDICEVDRAPPKFNKDTIRYPVFVFPFPAKVAGVIFPGLGQLGPAMKSRLLERRKLRVSWGAKWLGFI